MKQRIFFFVILAIAFNFLAAKEPCPCFTISNTYYQNIKDSLREFQRVKDKNFFHCVGTGWAHHKWENQYYNAQAALLKDYINRPVWFSDYQKDFLIDNAVIDVIKEYALEESFHWYKGKTSNPEYEQAINRTHVRAATCHHAFEKYYPIMVDNFASLFRHCQHKHASARFFYEYGLLETFRGNYDHSVDLIAKTFEMVEKTGETELLTADAYRNFGITCFEAMAYEKAIQALSEAIKRDPENKNNYFHRASAYFETGNFDLAINDFLNSDMANLPSVELKVSADFKNALMNGLAAGLKESFIEFIPSLLATTYGLGSAMWALAESPIETTAEFANTCYEVAQNAVEFCKTLDGEKIDEMAVELKYLYEQFDSLNEAQKGSLIGYAAGKYGVDILMPGAMLKGFSLFKKLKEVNRAYNLKTLSSSEKAREALIASSLRHKAERAAYFENIKIHVDKQNKHVPGAHNYQKHASIITHPDPQILLQRFAGKGKPKNNLLLGDPGYKEVVDFGEPIGIWKHEKFSPEGLSTNKGIIHYSKDGAHIVPSNPNSW